MQGVSGSELGAGNFLFNQEPVTHNAGTMSIADGAIMPLGGTIDNTGTIALNGAGATTQLEVIASGITLQGGGQVVLSDSDANVISGTAADVTLTNVDNTISGAGQLGGGLLGPEQPGHDHRHRLARAGHRHGRQHRRQLGNAGGDRARAA